MFLLVIRSGARVGAPRGQQSRSRPELLEVAEQGLDPVGSAGEQRVAALRVESAQRSCALGGEAVGEVPQDQVAARWNGVAVGVDDRACLGAVRQEVQRAGQHQRDGLVRVDEPAQFGRVQHGFRVTAVLVQQGRPWLSGEQACSVPGRQRFVVHVDHPVVPGDPVRYLVDVAHRRQSGTEVDELPDPAGERVVDGAAEEVPASPEGPGDSGQLQFGPLHEAPLGPEVVTASEEGVGDARRARTRQVHFALVAWIFRGHSACFSESRRGAAPGVTSVAEGASAELLRRPSAVVTSRRLGRKRPTLLACRASGSPVRIHKVVIL